MSEAAKRMRQTYEVTGDKWFLAAADEIERLRVEVAQCAVELEEAAKLLGGHGLSGMSSIYDAAARRAKAAAIEFVYEQSTPGKEG